MSLPRKERRTFTLDRELVGYIKQVAKERRKPSLSAALEELLLESKLRSERGQIRTAMAAYYDSLSDDDGAKLRERGGFAESQFPRTK
jgi:hypothetical protein